MTLTPGLYRATVRGVVQIVLVDDTGMGHLGTWGAANTSHAHSDDVYDARPLIVIEAVDDNHFPSLVAYLRKGGWDLTADQIEAQTKVRRIPEPSGGEFVMASLCDRRHKFLRIRRSDNSEFRWANLDDGHLYMWDSLKDPEATS